MQTVRGRRISVVGNSGSGKTTLARALAEALALPHLELDAVFHQQGWRPLETGEFRRRVSDFTAAPGWVVDGNYSAVQDIVWDRADTVLWIDLPRWIVMRRVIGRTVRRVVTRAELWNGNREPWRNLVRVRAEDSIIMWAWRRHPVTRARYAAARSDPANAHLRFIRLGSPREVTALVRELAPAG